MPYYTPTTINDTYGAFCSMDILGLAVGYIETSREVRTKFDALRRTKECLVRPPSNNPTYLEALGELGADLLFSLAVMDTHCSTEVRQKVEALARSTCIMDANVPEYRRVFDNRISELSNLFGSNTCDACSEGLVGHPAPSFVMLNYYLWVDGPIDSAENS